jgi:hypothetical protein
MVNPAARDRQPSPAFFIAHPPHYSRTEVYHRGHDSLSGLLGLVRLTLREALELGASQVTELARRHPRFAFVAVLDSEQPLPLTAVFRSARRLRDVRLVPAWKDGTPSLSDLKSAIWDDTTLHDDLFRWLRAHASVPLPIIATAMEIVWAGYRDPSRIALPDIHAGAWRVPPLPRDWMGLGRGLRAARAIQLTPNVNIARIANGIGLHDGASLSRLLLRSFGHRPTFIRPRLSWEWLIADWCMEKGCLKQSE